MTRPDVLRQLPEPTPEPTRESEVVGLSITGLGIKELRDVTGVVPLSHNPSENAEEIRVAREKLTRLGLERFADIGVTIHWERERRDDPLDRERPQMYRTLVWNPDYTRRTEIHAHPNDVSDPSQRRKAYGVTYTFSRAVAAPAKVA